jgi:hypothetical protein
MAGAGGTLVASITFYYQTRKDRLNTLFKVYELLNSNANRNARRRIINLHAVRDKKNVNEEKTETLLRMNALKKEDLLNIHAVNSNQLESKETVKADFDYVGSLIRNGVISEKKFLEVFWFEVLVCLNVLKEEITEKQRRVSGYMKNFSYLKVRADSYRKNRNYPENKTVGFI